MNVKMPGASVRFLSGGGEMGELTRNYDWAQTSLGATDQWPQSLRTTLSILLNSKFPMFLWWGPKLICFYNDAYRPSLGNNGKHPYALGKPGEEIWPEIWSIIKPLIDNVLINGEATWSEDQLIPIYRNGRLEDVYWTFGYSPVYDEDVMPAGVLVTCTETTEKVKNLHRLNESKEQLQFAIEAAELGTWDYNPFTNKFTANNRLKEWFGLPPDTEIELQTALDAIAEKDRERVTTIIQRALDYSSGGHYNTEYTIANSVSGKEIIVLAKGKARFDENKRAYRFNGTLQDITEQVLARKKVEESEQRVRTIIENAPFPIGVYTGKEMRIAFANQSILDIWGKGNDVIGKLYAEVLPELENQEVFKQLDSVFTTGVSFYAKNQRIDLVVDGQLRPFYFNYSFIALFDTTGQVYGVMSTAADVTDLNISKTKTEESEKRLSIVVNASELGMWELNLKTGATHYSDRYLEILGYEKGVVLNHTQLLKHLHPEDRPHRDKAFEKAYQTGQLHFESRLVLNDHSIRWVAAKGKVFYNEEQEPVKLVGTIQDITEEKNYQNDLEEREQKFRLLADSMPQFVWTGDAAGNLNYFNQSVYNYSGLSPEQVHKEGWLQIVHPDEREKNVKSWMDSVQTGNDFNFEHRFRRYDGEYRWQLSRAIAQRDAAGTIQMWVGTSTDIQDQKVFVNELERQVRERTRELEQMNAELKSFAYVSSHDLQEPLRKIQTFASRILERDIHNLSESGKNYFGRIQSAAKRMQALIDDLLAFTRVNSTERKFEYIHLGHIVNEVKAEFEETIQEKQAIIEFHEMCEANIIPFQFRQMMHNLIGNALKFTIPERLPHIIIKSEIAKGSRWPHEKLAPQKLYCHISISDNGIGFEPRFNKQIFEVFQRLHTKEQYEGTGIGLAIVKKIVENHSGAIRASGHLNKGATFDIYLPHDEMMQ